MTEDPIGDVVLDNLLQGGPAAQSPGQGTGTKDPKPRVAAMSNHILTRLRMAALLVIGHERYPDALSRLTNTQVGIFALFDAIRIKGEVWMARPALPRHSTGSRYYALKELYRQADIARNTAPAMQGGLVAPLDGSILSTPAPTDGGRAGAGGLPPAYVDPCMYFGVSTFIRRYKAMSQSILGEGRTEYRETIEEKPTGNQRMKGDDLNVPKPSLVEEVTGKRPRNRSG